MRRLIQEIVQNLQLLHSSTEALKEIISTGVIQMMLPVLSSEYFVYHHMQSTAVVRVYGKYDTSDFAVIRDKTRPSIHSDDSKRLHGIQSTRTTEQVASFDSG